MFNPTHPLRSMLTASQHKHRQERNGLAVPKRVSVPSGSLADNHGKQILNFERCLDFLFPFSYFCLEFSGLT